MASPLSQPLRTLLDSSAGLGAGLVDSSGLLIAACGLHDGQDAEALSALLAARWPQRLTGLLGDEGPGEEVVLLARYGFCLHWLANGHLVYLMTRREQALSGARRHLQRAALELTDLGAASGVAPRQRLEQPRQFPRDELLR